LYGVSNIKCPIYICFDDVPKFGPPAIFFVNAFVFVRFGNRFNPIYHEIWQANGGRIYSLAVIKPFLPFTDELRMEFQSRLIIANTKGLLDRKCSADEETRCNITFVQSSVGQMKLIEPFPTKELHKSMQNLEILVTPHERSLEEIREARDTELAIM